MKTLVLYMIEELPCHKHYFCIIFILYICGYMYLFHRYLELKNDYINILIPYDNP